MMKSALRRAYRIYFAREQRRLRESRLREVRRVLQKSVPPYRLHLGCGVHPFNDWINLDNQSQVWDAKPDALWDVTLGLPVPDASCSFIYSEHLLEHLRVEQGVALLRECGRALAAHGVVRVAMPALDALVGSYTGGEPPSWQALPEYQFIQTRAEMLNVAFRWWGHQWLYDREELHRRLGEAGFGSVKDVAFGHSDHDELRNRETRDDSLLICEATK